MKTDTSPEPARDPELSRLLQSWHVAARVSPAFKSEVWHLIAAESSSAGVAIAPLLRPIARWLERSFARPAWSVGYALAVLAAGLWAGYWQATQQTERWDQLMSARYVQTVDPYSRTASRP
jgi:hypothetical protein